MKPRVCILRTDGTNCDQETAYAFEKAGAETKLVHVNELRNGSEKLSEYAILTIPGGFTYGDDVASGKILAVELMSFLGDQMQAFVDAGRLILGICNGFQVLVRTGLLPFGQLGRMSVTLTNNSSGRFQCQWVQLRIVGACVFTRGLEGRMITLPIAHGEGKFFAGSSVLRMIEQANQTVTRYEGMNPNGSLNAIAGMCDPTGRIFGLMPHPERFVEATQHPNWRRGSQDEPHGLQIFRNAVEFAAQM